MKSSDYRFIGITKSSTTSNWHNYKLAGDIDFISYFMQYHIGILPIGTIAWTMQQSLEKYCKAILNKYDNVKFTERLLSKNPYGHNLDKLWQEIKNYTIQFSYEQAYDDFVEEINKITTDTRYLNNSVMINLGLIETFTVLGCEFRYEILEKSAFKKSFFGLKKDLILSRYFLNWYSYEDLFKKLMHISIEHGYSFSGLGVPDPYEHTNVNLSKATAKFCQCGVHSEIEKECPICNRKIWVNGKRDMRNDAIILNEYFGMPKKS